MEVLRSLFLMVAFHFSLIEIQNARGIMDVLAEMLTALDPSNKEVSIVDYDPSLG